MKKSKPSEIEDDGQFDDLIDNDPMMTWHHRVESYEKERKILLDLSNDITRIREKNDLITLFSLRIKKLFYFTHAIVTLIDREAETYTPFLLDHEASPTRNYEDYALLTRSHFPLNEPFIQQVVNSDGPRFFRLDDIMDKPGSPKFLRANHDAGVREILMTPLKSKMQTIGFLHIYSDRAGSFSSDFQSVINSMAPQISGAVSNIIKNEDISYKEKVNEVLLSLSNEMVTVRDRKDLLKVINFSLKKLIPFAHSVMTVLAENGKTYKAFLTDEDTRPAEFSKYNEAISHPCPVEDGIYDLASCSPRPLVFRMKCIDMSQAPLWLRLNFTAGAREMVIKVLPDEGVGKHSLILFANVENTFDHKSLNIIDRIASQLSTAARNIAANEQILAKEQEKSFLLDFGQDIASVRTKDDLEEVISSVLQRVLNIRLSMIRIIEDDGVTLSPYMYDKGMFYGEEPIFLELASKNITIDEYLTSRVLKSKDPVMFNIAEEDRKGNSAKYLYFWKKVGLKNAYGAPLRVGNKNVGTLWLLTDEVNFTLLKGICAQISIAISNIRANEKVLAYKQMLEIENDQLKEQIKIIYNFSEIVGNGAEMQKVYHLISLVAESKSSVLLLGETGTGKELIARAIHNASPRKNKLMIKVNCAAMPANLIESELFGHEKGAFTGATERRIGKFELANNSTLFLDEIGEMPLEAQVKLLRVLQEKEVERVGGKTTISVDVRIIAATNRNLEEEVKAGRFRSDLFYRLNVFPINLPPLRDRTEDIVPLANFFVERYSKNAGRKINTISFKVLQELKSYLWPGNVRELEHLIERSVLLTNDTVIRQVHLPKNKSDSKNEAVDFANRTLEEMERSYIIETIRRCSGKLSGRGGAAEYLDIPATTLHSKIKKLAILKSEYF